MKALFARFTPSRAIGLSIGEQEVSVSLIAGTPFGAVELASRTESYAGDGLPEVVTQLLGPLIGQRKRRIPVAVGISALRVFYSTRPIKPNTTETSAQVLLHEVLQSPNICIDDMVVELIKSEPGKRKLASIASCRRKYLTGLLEILEGLGVQPFRVEPAPCALLRAGAEKRRVPRKSKTALQIFLGEREALVVVSAGGSCILWRSFNLPKGGETAALCLAIRSCRALIVHCGIDTSPDVVVVYGRPDLREQLTGAEFGEKADAPVVWAEGPGLAGAGAAYGLALGCLTQQSDEAFDLSQSLKPSPTLWQIFPYGEAAVQLALVLCLALFLLARSSHVQQALVPVQTEITQRAWLTPKQQGDLQKEQQDLTHRVDAIRKFVGSRILWTTYTHDIAARLPAQAALVSFQGMNELEQMGKGAGSGVKPKKSFLLRATAPISKNGSTPKEVDQFLASLRGHPLLQRDFPVVELADLKWFQPNKGAPADALFSIVCLPKSTKGPAAPAEGKEADKGAH